MAESYPQIIHKKDSDVNQILGSGTGSDPGPDPKQTVPGPGPGTVPDPLNLS